ncbi:ankyrin repeat domain-containing protein [Wolbachia pipientis]|uniref:ankyrin repeat domain-containing protein n=1 Tax=Wolbachia pipientis TaxID=955 RepID=UPI0025A490FF|nr:ankyrin repeat domain-containing protein [Wolbachia pipientis]MDM8335634.1 ankyrin repeat domain-containing protein [Wolbachia pipientis]
MCSIDSRKINIDAKKDNKTFLHLVASESSGKEALNILIKGGAGVKAVGKDGNTPLHLAVSHYQGKRIIKVLVEGGADVHAKNNEGKTPRDLAEDYDIKKLLRAAEEKQLEKLSKKMDLPQDDKDTIRFLGKTEPTSVARKEVFAGCVTAVLTTVAVALFATRMVAVELMPILIAVAAVTIAALAVGGTTYMLSKPNTKVDETKGIQVKGDMPKVTS